MHAISQYSLPAEWHRQWGVMLTWPHHDTDWKDNLSDAEQCYQCIARIISQYENVLIICKNQVHQSHIQSLLNNVSMERLSFVQADYNDTWVRDYGFISTFDQNGRIRLLNFTFNAWGEKFDAGLDNAINHHLFKHPLFRECDTQDVDLVLEGGSIESDGNGTLLTTERCLLNPNRNPKLSKTDIEQQLKQSLGIERILWLKHGEIVGDDTDAHIDTLVRFVNDTCIAYVKDTNSQSLFDMEDELQQLVTASGEPYELIPLPSPYPPIKDADDRQLAASYANFLILNKVVLLPIYGVKEDEIAIRQLQKAFPHHNIEPVNCRALIEQNGSLHCITMQIPA